MFIGIFPFKPPLIVYLLIFPMILLWHYQHHQPMFIIDQRFILVFLNPTVAPPQAAACTRAHHFARSVAGSLGIGPDGLPGGFLSHGGTSIYSWMVNSSWKIRKYVHWWELGAPYDLGNLHLFRKSWWVIVNRRHVRELFNRGELFFMVLTFYNLWLDCFWEVMINRWRTDGLWTGGSWTRGYWLYGDYKNI